MRRCGGLRKQAVPGGPLPPRLSQGRKALLRFFSSSGWEEPEELSGSGLCVLGHLLGSFYANVLLGK